MYEQKFGEHKTEMRIRLADLSSTNSWNQVVLGSFIKLFTPKARAQEKDQWEPHYGIDQAKLKKVKK